MAQPAAAMTDRQRTAEDRICNVLFLCTGNSARSIMAEAAINRWGIGRFKGYSAGSHPVGRLNPFTVELLHKLNYSTDGLRSKDWAEFAAPGAPVMDFVFTVCDKAAGEVCPVWPGQPLTAHWGFRDPVEAEGDDDDKRRVFRQVYTEIESRIKIFVSLPIASLDRLALQQRIDELGRKPPGAG
ncbi:MAG: arsenate reductase ArsC [Alphaproteobacteria bacterium]